MELFTHCNSKTIHELHVDVLEGYITLKCMFSFNNHEEFALKSRRGSLGVNMQEMKL